MTLFTALGLLNTKESGMAPISAICQAYIEWLYTQKGIRSKRFNSCWIGEIPELNIRRAPGQTCISALETIMQGREPMNNSKGCGGIMRIAPIPLYGISQNRIKDVAVLDELSADAAKLTHKHPLGYIPAYIMSHIIYCLAIDMHPTRDSFGEYVNEAMTQAEEKYAHEKESIEIVKSLLDKALVLANNNISGSVAKVCV